MIRRYLQEQILESLNHFPAVLLTGARQVGKSTLAQAMIGPSWDARYLTLDDRAVLDSALRDPDGLVQGTPTPVVIDEVQKAPDLLRAIKLAIDRERKPGQYLLTGSANIMTLAGVSETLAGRVALHTLQPFSWTEFLERPRPAILGELFLESEIKEILVRLSKAAAADQRDEITKRILTGGYPPVALMTSDSARRQWFSAYRQTYLERDLLNIRAIENLPDFNRLLAMVALRSGTLLNLSDLSRETGLPFTTLRRYMNLLDVTYQVFLVRPYYAHVGKRLVKTPKIYFGDTGFACHLRGADDWSMLQRQGAEGGMVETWVASELVKLLPLADPRMQLFFWRTQTGHEVDFLVERAGELVAIEVKWAHRIADSDIKGLRRCEQDLGDKLRFSIVLYAGREVVPLSRKVAAIPFSVFFGVES